VSGLTVVYDPKAEAGKRVTEVTVAGAALDPAKVYKVAMNDYMLGGGDGYKMLKGAKQVVIEGTGALVAKVVMDYVEKAGSVQPTAEGRIKALGQ
jgi:2',3'-cyclic-nucleotide 2'-phosphodiesterase (5'-nucleotidase family)